MSGVTAGATGRVGASVVNAARKAGQRFIRERRGEAVVIVIYDQHHRPLHYVQVEAKHHWSRRKAVAVERSLVEPTVQDVAQSKKP